MSEPQVDPRSDLQAWIDRARDGELADGRHTRSERKTRKEAETRALLSANAVNNRAPWTPEEDEVAMAPELSAADAAEKLGRTLSAVKSRRTIIRLGGSLA